MGRKRKPCDGSANCYLRHERAGETAPARCKRSYRIAMRRYRQTGVWAGGIIYGPRDDERRYRVTKRETPKQRALREKKKPEGL